MIKTVVCSISVSCSDDSH